MAALTVGDYWTQHVRRLESSKSVKVSARPGSEATVLEDPGNPRRGVVDARVWFDDDAYLDVWEIVEIDNSGTPSRKKYSYHLEIDDDHVDRWDYDPDYEGLEHHRNRPRVAGGVTHEPDQRHSLKEVLDQCWDILVEAREESEQLEWDV